MADHDQVSPELVREIDAKMRQLEDIAAEFHQAQEYVNRAVQDLIVDTNA